MPKVNSKKPITLTNRTNYFDKSSTRTKVTFSSPTSYQSRRIKIEGYETRLYWQFRYCEENNGQTFFYTLTYNDAAMPKYNGQNCFDYEDLRDLLTGGFRKQLLRKYGTTFKYFIGAELGDGKGSRGMHNNPHYHVLFFLEDAHKERYPYVKISPEDFRHLVRMYWQEFDEDVDGFRDYNTAKYGIAKEGENVGRVTDFRACMYCAKYVTKDAKLVQQEGKVLKRAKMLVSKLYKPHKDEHDIMNYHYANELACAYFEQVICKMYNRYLTNHTTIRGKFVPAMTNSQLIQMLVPEIGFSTGVFNKGNHFYDVARWYDMVYMLTRKLGLWEDFCSFRRSYLEPKIKEYLNEYRNRYSNKVRISQGVGDYALSTIDKLEPSVEVPSKNGFKRRPISMYYYRKLYMDVVKDAKNQNVYVLNADGKSYKLYNLSHRVEKMSETAKNNIEILLNNEELYNKMKESDVNTTNFLSFHGFFQNYKYLLEENKTNELYERYAEYKLVYENRFFKFDVDAAGNVDGMPVLNVFYDYDRFLTPSYYTADYCSGAVMDFLESPDKDWLPYSQHPYFLRYLGLFSVLDMCTDYWFVQKDDKAQREAEQRAAVKRFHTQEKLKEFYSRFQN